MSLEDELIKDRQRRKDVPVRSGQLEMELGMAAATERAGEDWVTTARKQMASLCRDGAPFSAEDVIAVVGLPPGITHNAVGSLFHTAAKEGWIKHVGYRASSRPDRHGGMVKVWITSS